MNTSDEWLTNTRTSYDTVASAYTELVRDAGFAVNARWLLGPDETGTVRALPQ